MNAQNYFPLYKTGMPSSSLTCKTEICEQFAQIRCKNENRNCFRWQIKCAFHIALNSISGYIESAGRENDNDVERTHATFIW